MDRSQARLNVDVEAQAGEKSFKVTMPNISSPSDLLSPGGSRLPQKSFFKDPLNHSALPVAAYCGASILMTVVNKFVVSGKHFSMNFLLLAIQSIVCIATVFLLKRLGFLSFRELDWYDAKRWFPISTLLVGVIYTGSKALQYLPIPVYTIFKNMTIILIAYGEVLWFGGSVLPLTLMSFLLMVLSSIIAAFTDISRMFSSLSGSQISDPVNKFDEFNNQSSASRVNIGYAWMIVNCIVSASYVLAMRKRIKLTQFRDWDTMMYNNLLSIPVLLVCSLLLEDWSGESLRLNFPAEGRSFLLLAMCFSGAAAVLISYTTAWCVRTTSSTTFSMVGALNKLPVAASGIVFMGEPATLNNVLGIFVGFLAGLTYAISKTKPSGDRPHRP